MANKDNYPNGTKYLRDIIFRMEVDSKVTIGERGKLHGLAEAYSAKMRRRMRIVGKTYGNRAKQREDAKLTQEMGEIRSEIHNIVTAYTEKL